MYKPQICNLYDLVNHFLEGTVRDRVPVCLERGDATLSIV